MPKKQRKVRNRAKATQQSGSPTGSDARDVRSSGSLPPMLPQSRDASQTGSLLSLSLSAAVPLEVVMLYQGFSQREGIANWMVAEAFLFGQVLAERGDRLLFKSERQGETAALFTGLARSLAILSFVPGGIPFAGITYDALAMLSGWYGEEAARAFCQKALKPYFDAVIDEIPVACWSEGSDPIAFGTSNAIRWFERADDDDLLHLRDEGFGGHATWVPDPSSRTGSAHSLLTHLFEQAQGRVRWSPSSSASHPEMAALGDQLLLAARDSSRDISFQVESGAAEAWLALYKHSLLSGESWLLPPAPGRKKKRSDRHDKKP